MATNSQAVDFRCMSCDADYQLKAFKVWSDRRIPDAGYEAMMRAIRSDSVPNLLVMRYGLDWSVNKLLLVPSFFFSPSAIQRRKPLGPGARRAGWIGCNICLNRIAKDGKIVIVDENQAVSASLVRKKYREVRPLASLRTASRGWTLDVLNAIREIGKSRFPISDVYAFEDTFAKMYPNNVNIRPKLRQQIQVLRDMGFVKFEGKGLYSMLRLPRL